MPEPMSTKKSDAMGMKFAFPNIFIEENALVIYAVMSLQSMGGHNQLPHFVIYLFYVELTKGCSYLPIIFIFDGCPRSLAVVTPVKYVHDWSSSDKHFGKRSNCLNGEINQPSFSKSNLSVTVLWHCHKPTCNTFWWYKILHMPVNANYTGVTWA